MKKILFLSLIFSAAILTTSYAQTGGPAVSAQQVKESEQSAMLKQMKEKIVPPMVEKTGLTEAQANRVIEINFEMRQAAAGLKDLSDADRSKKIAELKADKEKKMNELLTSEQISAVKAFYEEWGKQQQKAGN